MAKSKETKKESEKVKGVKKRRITDKDWDKVAEFIKNTLTKRKANKCRSSAEKKWKEVDRQVAMEPMSRQSKDPNQSQDWRSAIELGELSRASEVLSADIRRMAFPQNRAWFDPHIEIQPTITEEGVEFVDEDEQIMADGLLRSLMAQQQLDFAFKARTDLSVKEALHHGGYVAEVDDMTMLGSLPDGRLKDITAPVWVPHSMWNCYPDDAQSVSPGALFYTGSMIINSYMSHAQLQNVSGPGWIRKNIDLLEDPKDKDHELTAYHGDITIKRQGGDIYLPNVKAIAVKDKLIYYKPNELPYSKIIYNGYERLDVRDPYYTSPLVKMSPTQKIGSEMANKLIDSIELKVEPPIIYDGNDPDFVASGGPDITPGAKTPTKNMANFKVVDNIGDPSAALTALQFNISELQKGTSVDSVRSGMTSGAEQTATEVERTRQGGQIRTIDFLDKHELQGLRPYLYLQHECNKKNLKSYQFYNPEMDSPDFVRVTNKDIKDLNVHFDVVGSKGLIEEDQRQAQTMQVTQFAYSIGAGEKININKLLVEMYQDAGNKNPERFLNITNERTAASELEQVTAQFQQLQEQSQQLAQENQSLKENEESEIEKAKIKGSVEMARQDNEEDSIKLKAENDTLKIEREAELNRDKFQSEADLNEQKAENKHQETMFSTFVKNVGQPTEVKEEAEENEIEPVDIMAKFEEAMENFTKIQAAPKKVIRNKEGFIESVETETTNV